MSEEGRRSGRSISFFGLIDIPVNFWTFAVFLLSLVFVVLLGFRIMFVDFVDRHQLGYKFDRRSGEITILDRTGYIITPPVLVNVHTVDTRPGQVCISAIERVLNCKLVRFDRNGIDLFIEWHGRDDYHWTKVNGADSTGSLGDILKAYAYDGRNEEYPFLDVMTELVPEDDGKLVE